MSNNIFHCNYRNCQHYSSSFNRLLTHVWDRHKKCLSFNYVCGISIRTSTYTNQQNYERNVKSKHKWLYDVISDETNDMNLSGSNSFFGNNDVSPILDIIGENSIDKLVENNTEFNKSIGERLLDLRENVNVTTAATYKISGFLMDILQIERRIFSEAIKKSMKKSPCT